jgi:superfamily II DNA or RNA helicase
MTATTQYPGIVPVAERDDVRLFDVEDRAALDRKQKGLCAACGEPLRPHPHADHILEWAAGGQTVIENGQLLHYECHVDKGWGSAAKADTKRTRWTVGPWTGFPLRKWQRKSLAKYLALKDVHTTYLGSYVTAAGKTTLGCAAARQLISSRQIDCVLVLAPSTVIVQQWLADAERTGLALADGFRSHRVPRYLNGVAMTYAALPFAKERIRNLLTMPTVDDGSGLRPARVLVILDEVHHTGETTDWGVSLQDLMATTGGAAYRLLLTGTPWRTDGEPIPGITPERDADDVRTWIARPHDVYSYLDSLLDGDVTREVELIPFDADATLIDRYAPDQGEQTMRLADDLKPGQTSQVLRTILGFGMGAIFDLAVARLNVVRESDEAAQGIVCASSEAKVAEYREMLAQRVGAENVVSVVYTDGASAKADLLGFRNSGKQWLVTIRMAAEGYSNNHLRVGVYASTYKSKLALWQFIGRLLRFNSSLRSMAEQPVWLYLPNDADLLRQAQALYSEIEEYHRIKAAALVPPQLREGPPRRPPARQGDGFVPISADNVLALDMLSPRSDAERGAMTEPLYLQAHRLLRELQALLRNSGNADAMWTHIKSEMLKAGNDLPSVKLDEQWSPDELRGAIAIAQARIAEINQAVEVATQRPEEFACATCGAVWTDGVTWPNPTKCNACHRSEHQYTDGGRTRRAGVCPGCNEMCEGFWERGLCRMCAERLRTTEHLAAGHRRGAGTCAQCNKTSTYTWWVGDLCSRCAKRQGRAHPARRTLTCITCQQTKTQGGWVAGECAACCARRRRADTPHVIPVREGTCTACGETKTARWPVKGVCAPCYQRHWKATKSASPSQVKREGTCAACGETKTARWIGKENPICAMCYCRTQRARRAA